MFHSDSELNKYSIPMVTMNFKGLNWLIFERLYTACATTPSLSTSLAIVESATFLMVYSESKSYKVTSGFIFKLVLLVS